MYASQIIRGDDVKYLRVIVILLSITLLFAGCGSTQKPDETKPAAHSAPAAPAKDQGGTTTDVPKAIEPDTVDYVKFFDVNNGLAISEAKYLCRTQDGGNTWVDITPDTTGRISERAVFFIDKNNGWVSIGDFDRATQDSGEYRGEIFITHDGGEKWNKSNVENLMGPQMYFIDKDNGWILDHRGAGMMHEEVAMLRTTDGGLTWETVNQADPQNEKPGDMPFSGDKSGFTFLNKDTGFLTGYTPVDNSVYLFKTQDGGKTWQDYSFAVGKELEGGQYNSYPPVFFDDKNGLLPVGNGEIFAAYTTADGGKTWEDPSLLDASAYDSKMNFLDMNNWLIADTGYIYVTTDGGKTWTKTEPNMDIADATEIDFVSLKRGYMVMDNRLYVSDDGGQTWK